MNGSKTAKENGPYPGWEAGSIDVVERAVERYGGWRRWEKPYEIEVRFRKLSGMIPTLKGLGRTISMPGKVRIRPSLRTTYFEDYPAPGLTGIFENGRVAIADSMKMVEESVEHRRKFRGLGKWLLWTYLDAIYFFGYALWHYHAVPFTLREARFLRPCEARWEGSSLRGVEVEFDRDVPTHSARQRFFFDAEGLIRRHDYVADIIGPMARGAHFWRDMEFPSGLPVARERRVVLRLGRFPTPWAVLAAKLDGIRVRDL